jgi:hypothetical protein
MGSNIIPKSDRGKILEITKEHGFLRRPKFYIEKAKELYGCEVSNSSVTKAIGTWSTRLRLNKSKVRKKSHELLDLCFWDYAAASSNLWSSSKEINE